jgi:hypothetical protein
MKLVLFKSENREIQAGVVIEATEISKAIETLKPLGLTFNGFCYLPDFDFEKFKYTVLDETDEKVEGLTEYAKLALCRDEIDVDMLITGYEAGSNEVNTLTVVNFLLKG